MKLEIILHTTFSRAQHDQHDRWLRLCLYECSNSWNMTLIESHVENRRIIRTLFARGEQRNEKQKKIMQITLDFIAFALEMKAN